MPAPADTCCFIASESFESPPRLSSPQIWRSPTGREHSVSAKMITAMLDQLAHHRDVVDRQRPVARQAPRRNSRHIPVRTLGAACACGSFRPPLQSARRVRPASTRHCLTRRPFTRRQAVSVQRQLLLGSAEADRLRPKNRSFRTGGIIRLLPGLNRPVTGRGK